MMTNYTLTKRGRNCVTGETPLLSRTFMLLPGDSVRLVFKIDSLVTRDFRLDLHAARALYKSSVAEGFTLSGGARA